MDETFCTRAVILNRKSFRESDSRIIVYSFDYGKLDLVVRGTKRVSSKLVSQIEPITLSEIMIVRGKHYNYAGAVRNEDCFFNIKNNLEKLRAAGEAIGIFIERVKENQKDEELFFLLKDFLDYLNVSEELKTVDYISSAFRLKLLKVLGYCPEINGCVICKKSIKDEFYFDFSKSGLVCRRCYKPDSSGLSVSKKSIEMLRLMLDKSFNDVATGDGVDGRHLREVKTTLRRLYEYQI